jgi:hypothetical protein
VLPACSVLRTSRGTPPRFSFRTAEVTEPGSGGAYESERFRCSSLSPTATLGGGLPEEVCESGKPRRFQEEPRPTIWDLLLRRMNMNGKSASILVLENP